MLQEELISQSMQYQPSFTQSSCQKMAKLPCQFDKKNFFSGSNFFMHIFHMSVTYLHSFEKIQWKLKEELISQSMHYWSLFTRCSC